MKAGNYFSQLPKWAKGIVAVGAVFVAGYAGYQLYKAIKKQAGKGEEKDVTDKAKDEERDLIQSGYKPTYNDSVYESSANLIATKLDGCETISSEVDVFAEVLRVCKNKLDWTKLIRAFGVRAIDNCGVGTGDTTYSLPTLLKDQLDSYVPTSGKKVYQLLVDAMDKRGIKI